MLEGRANTVVAMVNVDPAIEERFIDWLLERDDSAGFTSYAVHGHGSDHRRLSVAEQVSGRQRRVEFRVELSAAAIEAFVTQLRASFAGVDIYYLVTPVLQSGHLRGDIS